MKIKVFFLLFLFTSVIHAQDFNSSQLDSLFNQIEKFDKGMGNISIFHDGKEVYQRSYGYADIVSRQKINSETKFRIGSITKTFTASIIMKLIEKGQISLTTTLDQFYPQVHNAERISIHHLLQHRSGIANVTGTADYFKWNTQYQSKNQLLKRIIDGGVSFSPDKKFEYSNSNYILLTWIAEDVSGKSYTDLLNEIIIKPCRLKNTFAEKIINTNNNEAISYLKLPEWKLEPETDLSIPLGAGSIVSTATDLNTFFTFLFTNKLVSMESLSRMKTIKDNFGLGLIQVPFYDKKGYGHTGGIDGFHANAFYFPEDKLSISITSNALDFPLNDIIVAALSIYFGKEYNLPQFKRAVNPPTEILDKCAGIYSSSGFPLKITIKRNGNVLIAQATGQPAFPLEFVEGNKYKFDQAALEMEFFPEKNELVFKQMGGVFKLQRE